MFLYRSCITAGVESKNWVTCSTDAQDKFTWFHGIKKR